MAKLYADTAFHELQIGEKGLQLREAMCAMCQSRARIQRLQYRRGRIQSEREFWRQPTKSRWWGRSQNLNAYQNAVDGNTRGTNGGGTEDCSLTASNAT
jgi:hypothetical protein